MMTYLQRNRGWDGNSVSECRLGSDSERSSTEQTERERVQQQLGGTEQELRTTRARCELVTAQRVQSLKCTRKLTPAPETDSAIRDRVPVLRDTSQATMLEEESRERQHVQRAQVESVIKCEKVYSWDKVDG
eukprot:642702-Rhodomonas_salina.1